MKNRWVFSLGVLVFSMSPVIPVVSAAETAPTTTTPSTSTELEMELPMKLDKCTSDVKEFCSTITPGKGRVLFCLKAHEDKISKNCKDQIHEVMKEWKEFHHACRNDIHTFCKSVEPGEGRVMACLKSHQAELSTECKAMMK